MTPALTIAKGERGLIRLFTLDMPKEQVKFLQNEPGALEQVLGSELLDRDHVDIFDVADLDELGLSGYLIEGCGVPGANITDIRDDLDAIEGFVLVLRSRAFGDVAARLTPADAVRLVGQFSETPTDWSAQPLETESAKPFSAPQGETTGKERFPWGRLIWPAVIVVGALLYKLVIAP